MEIRNLDDIQVVSEEIRDHIEKRLFVMFPVSKEGDGRENQSTYVPFLGNDTTIVYMTSGSDIGVRVAIAPVCRSYNSNTSNPGRWRDVWVCSPKADGKYVISSKSNVHAIQIGSSGLFVTLAQNDVEEIIKAEKALLKAFAEIGVKY